MLISIRDIILILKDKNSSNVEQRNVEGEVRVRAPTWEERGGKKDIIEKEKRRTKKKKGKKAREKE